MDNPKFFFAMAALLAPFNPAPGRSVGETRPTFLGGSAKIIICAYTSLTKTPHHLFHPPLPKYINFKTVITRSCDLTIIYRTRRV